MIWLVRNAYKRDEIPSFLPYYITVEVPVTTDTGVQNITLPSNRSVYSDE